MKTITQVCDLIKGANVSAFFIAMLRHCVQQNVVSKTVSEPFLHKTTTPQANHQVASNRNTICQYICQVMIAIIILQSFKLVVLDHHLFAQSGRLYLANLLLHLCMFWGVLRFSLNGKLAYARTSLIFAFCSFVGTACLIWRFDVNVQYYFLLAMFITMYLIDSNEKILLLLCIGFQLIAFIGFTLHLPDLTHSQHQLTAIAQINTFIFAISCLVCAMFVRFILSRNWRALRLYEARQQTLINSVFPVYMGKQLLENSVSMTPSYLSQQKHMAVLFLDICDFTQAILKDKETSWQDTYSLFAEFDAINAERDTTRIKTNGDQYILVIGLQNSALSDHEIAEQAISASIAIVNFCKRVGTVKVRQGMSFGEVTYGVFDTKNPSFDVWGETVVRAARLEAIAQENAILIDSPLHQLVRQKYTFLPSAKVQLKGIGNTDVYSVLW